MDFPPLQRMVLYLIILGLPVVTAAAAREMALTELIETLRKEGHNILYSSDLINRSMRVSIESEDLDALAQLHPLGLGQPGDIVAAVIYYGSGQSRWVTGTELNLDGGFSARA